MDCLTFFLDLYVVVWVSSALDLLCRKKSPGSNPAFLEAKWGQVKTVMQGEGGLDRLTKEIIAVAVSAGSWKGYAWSLTNSPGTGERDSTDAVSIRGQSESSRWLR